MKKEAKKFKPELFGWKKIEPTKAGMWISYKIGDWVLSNCEDDLWGIGDYENGLAFTIRTNEEARIIFKSLGIIEDKRYSS